MLAALRRWTQPCTHAVNERVDAAKGGHEILITGGEVAQRAMLAKKAASDAASRDGDVLKRARATLVSLEDAARRLRRAAAEPDVHGVTGKAEFLTFAAGYESRAEAYRQALELLSGRTKLELPPVTAEERHAIAMAQLPGCVQVVMGKTVGGVDAVRHQAAASCCSAPTVA